ncbi:MAG TPA: peptidylprolyl isomerase [Candidatus Methylacidiphilales bacterium]|nr:peptidylprolyl isomerase [Candidatus Methylacidiphilales bacterium]
MNRPILYSTVVFSVFVLSLAWAQPAKAADPVVVLKTSMGEIDIQLDPTHAPITTANFLAYVNKKFYDGTIFHRVIPGFVIQGGGFTADMNQKSVSAPIKNEASNGLHNLLGTISMARTSDPDSATSQFFLNLVDNSSKLDPGGVSPDGYAVFGKIIKGLDVMNKIAQVPTTTVGPYGDVPVQAVTIISARQK